MMGRGRASRSCGSLDVPRRDGLLMVNEVRAPVMASVMGQCPLLSLSSSSILSKSLPSLVLVPAWAGDSELWERAMVAPFAPDVDGFDHRTIISNSLAHVTADDLGLIYTTKRAPRRKGDPPRGQCGYRPYRNLRRVRLRLLARPHSGGRWSGSRVPQVL